MGPSESPTDPPQNQAGTHRKLRKRPVRRPRTRRCLLKGCENRYRPHQARQRYCSAECRQAAQAWSRWKAQQRYRATTAGQEKRRAQCRRYRDRMRAKRQHGTRPPRGSSLQIFFRDLLRPARLLRGIRPPPPIPAPAVLFQGLPKGLGVRPGAGTALAGGSLRVTTAHHPSFPAPSRPTLRGGTRGTTR